MVSQYADDLNLINLVRMSNLMNTEIVTYCLVKLGKFLMGNQKFMSTQNIVQYHKMQLSLLFSVFLKEK